MTTPSPFPDFKDKIALVTGAGQGLGRQIAFNLALSGAKVIAVARSLQHLTLLDQELQSHHHSITLAPLDLASPTKIQELAGGIYQRFGKVDVLLANAALLSQLSPVAHINPDLFSRIMTVNVLANQQLIQCFHPLLLQADQPRAAFISCNLGKNLPFWGHYHASKVALEAIVAAYALENTHPHLRVNLLRPPAMYTPLYLQAFPGRKSSNNHESSSSPTPPSEHTLNTILHALSLHETRHGCTIDIHH